jgi:hypothetical protein
MIIREATCKNELQLLKDRTRLVNRKISEVDVKKSSLFERSRSEFGRFQSTNANFSSEAGAVLTFFAYFFVLRQKSNWGLGQSPIKNIVRSLCG